MLEMSAFQIFHGGNSTFINITSFTKPNFHVSLSLQRSTTVSLETRNLFNAFQWFHCIISIQSQDYGAC